MLTLLNDEEWATWSDNAIAKACGVSNHLVDDVKKALTSFSPSEKPSERTYTTKHGTTATMNTAKIGKTKNNPESANDGAPETGMVAGSVAQTTPLAVLSHDHAPTPAAQVIPAGMMLVEIEAYDEMVAGYKETLADNEMMGRVFDADDQIKAAMAEAARQRALADNAERTLAAKNGEYIERARAVTHWKNRSEKAEKALAKLEK